MFFILGIMKCVEKLRSTDQISLPSVSNPNNDIPDISLNSIRAWRIFLFLLFLLYPSISSTVLRLYVCKKVDAAWYLLADFNVVCYDATYYKFAYLGILFILIFPMYAFILYFV